MSNKITLEQAKARNVIYNEVIDHLEQEIYDTPEEREQGAIIKRQLISLKNRFIRDWNKKNGTNV
jgi:hypothetical protein